MAKYKIGITEGGDAGLNLAWANKLDIVDGAILITKQITPAFKVKALKNSKRLIIHATCTGYGGTVVEPNVPTPTVMHNTVLDLVQSGFPKDRIVIRVDPIIPTSKGLDRALAVIETFMNEGFSRYRVSIIDMYQHIRNRFITAKLPLPYGSRFEPNTEQIGMVDAMLLEAKEYWTSLGHASASLRIESCAEKGLKQAIPCGCISSLDLSLLGLDANESDSSGYQRAGCMCYSGKTELLGEKHPCGHQCLYCYWKKQGEK